jgi:hypothetical protein
MAFWLIWMDWEKLQDKRIAMRLEAHRKEAQTCVTTTTQRCMEGQGH